jgi:dienelactone hydrolase
MNHGLITICATLAATLMTARDGAGASLEGNWVGQWVRDKAALEVTIQFARTADSYQGSFDSERLRVIGIPFRNVKFQAPRVSWELVGDESTTAFEGDLHDDELRGRFRDGGAEGTFSLTRARSLPERPREESVSFRNGAVTLAGTVVLPQGKGPFPGVVFLHGSGPEGRWASHFVAVQFAHRGIAALMYDKRGVGNSTGDWQQAGPEELVQDAMAAVAALRARPEVAPALVGIHGHSQGGTLAPLVASRVKDLAFVVASAAPGVAADEREMFSMEKQLKVRSMSPADAELAKEFLRAIMATAYHGAPHQGVDDAWKKVRGKPWAFRPPPENDYFWRFARQLVRYDVPAAWGQVVSPVLLIYGESDQRVPARPSAAHIAGAYLGGKGRQLNVRFFDRADHTFRVNSERADRFDWPASAAGYPEAVLNWVDGVTRKPAPATP